MMVLMNETVDCLDMQSPVHGRVEKVKDNEYQGQRKDNVSQGCLVECPQNILLMKAVPQKKINERPSLSLADPHEKSVGGGEFIEMLPAYWNLLCVCPD